MTRAGAKAKMIELVHSLPYEQLRIGAWAAKDKGCLLQRVWLDSTDNNMYQTFHELFGVSSAPIFKTNDRYARDGSEPSRKALLAAIKSLPD